MRFLQHLASVSFLLASAFPVSGANVVCPSILKPVCGEKDGVRRTFGNECEARAAGFVVVAEGEC